MGFRALTERRRSITKPIGQSACKVLNVGLALMCVFYT